VVPVGGEVPQGMLPGLAPGMGMPPEGDLRVSGLDIVGESGEGKGNGERRKGILRRLRVLSTPCPR